MRLLDGSSFGPYRIVSRLGKGGMATVYKAYEPATDRYVALKVLPEDALESDDLVQRFQLEVKAVARLDHPHIVPLYATGVDEQSGVPWMALRLVPGGSLAELLRMGRMERGRALRILRGIASALDFAHAASVFHRDLKPQNVLIQDDHVLLADFGLAKILEGTAGNRTAIMGTPVYMAPEQWLGDVASIGPHVDIYSLGITAFEMLTGAPPFTADTPAAIMRKHFDEPIPIPTKEQLPEPFLAPLLKALAKNPADRWPTATAFVEALGKAEAAGHAPKAREGPRAQQGQTAPAVQTTKVEDSRSGDGQPERSLVRSARYYLAVLPVIILPALGIWLVWGTGFVLCSAAAVAGLFLALLVADMIITGRGMVW